MNKLMWVQFIILSVVGPSSSNYAQRTIVYQNYITYRGSFITVVALTIAGQVCMLPFIMLS